MRLERDPPWIAGRTHEGGLAMSEQTPAVSGYGSAAYKVLSVRTSEDTRPGSCQISAPRPAGVRR